MQLTVRRRGGWARLLLLAAAGMAAGLAFGWGAAGFPAGGGPSPALSSGGGPAVSAGAESVPDAPPPGAKRVCPTFDDGPSRTTPAVLEALADAGVPATFFVVAGESNERYLPLIRQARQEGHEIALHSASHRYSDIYRSADAFWADIELLRERLAPWLEGEEPLCLRFPGGSTNTVSRKYGGDGIMAELKEQAEARGLRWVDWNVSAEDAAGEKLSADAILRNVTEGSAGLENCVVLMHDSPSTGTTAEALPAIIDWYKDNGYAFCTVSQLYDSLA